MNIEHPISPAGDDELARVLLENVKDYAILMLDEQGSIIRWNIGAQRILGYQESEALGKKFAEIFTTEDYIAHQPERELKEAKEKGRAEDERWHVRKDGSKFWASGVVVPVWNDDGTLKGYAKILRNITERKQMEDSLAESNQRKDEFLATLSHELRNPLAAIMNSVQILRRGGSDSGIVNQATDVIDRQANTLQSMVNDLLDVARINAGKILLHRQKVKLNDVVQNAVQSMQPAMTSRNHALSVSVPQQAIWLDGDPVRIEQIVTNLLGNAAKYTERGGRIELIIEDQENQVILHVKDNGTGIASEMLSRIFEPFIQADQSLDRAQGGLGLGLTLIKRLVELHGGKIGVASEGIGLGSQFTVTLPTTSEVSEPPSQPPQPATSSSVHRCRILVVDDNKDAAASLSTLLSLLGHEVRVAYTGPESLHVAVLQIPEIVILDIGLPGMDGFQVARLMRQRPELAHTYLIAVTGYGSEEDRLRSQEAGFDAHVVKPADITKLQQMFASLSSGRRLPRE